MKKKFFRSFNLARKFIQKQKISTYKEWTEYARSAKKPANIPSDPRYTYRNSGWIDWYDWLGRSRDRRLYYVNDDFFKTWSSDMAYILGFWFADGYIDTDKNIFSITQHRKDSYLLQTMLHKMQSNYKLYFCNQMCRFDIKSPKIVRSIIELGGMPRKSLVCQFPLIPTQYLPDFIRGLWDGDGCICVHTVKQKERKPRKTVTSNFISGSKKFILELQKTLSQNISELKGHLHTYPRKNNQVAYLLSFGPFSTLRLGDFFYKNPQELRLLRKHNKFMKGKELYEETP